MSIGTIQTYLSFLRGLCAWIGKPGMVRTARDYGYTGPGRTEAAQRDKSWSSQGVDVDKKIEAVEKEDPRVGMALRLMFAFGMRCKEAVMFRPHRNVLSFEETGLGVPLENAKSYIHIKQGSKGGRPRFVAVCTPRQLAVLAEARGLAASVDASISDPMRPLKSCLRRFYYVVGKMGITHKEMNTASHGLRHEVNQDKYEEITGVPAPVRGGHCTDRELDKVARLEVSRMAGHARAKASSAYLGSAAVMRSKVQKKPPGAQPDLDVDASPQRKPNEDE